jgi:hypothetical protein
MLADIVDSRRAERLRGHQDSAILADRLLERASRVSYIPSETKKLIERRMNAKDVASLYPEAAQRSLEVVSREGMKSLDIAHHGAVAQPLDGRFQPAEK